MTLLEEIAQGESVSLEFKEFRPRDSLKFTKTVVAFANGRGGRILFGVEDGTGVVKGIDNAIVQKEMDAIADTIANCCTPSPCLHARGRELGRRRRQILLGDEKRRTAFSNGGRAKRLLQSRVLASFCHFPRYSYTHECCQRHGKRRRKQGRKCGEKSGEKCGEKCGENHAHLVRTSMRHAEEFGGGDRPFNPWCGEKLEQIEIGRRDLPCRPRQRRTLGSNLPPLKV